MVNITIWENKEGSVTRFMLQGHADYAEHGKDIVCASLSVLSQSTILGLRDIVKADIAYMCEEGENASLECLIKEEDAITRTLADVLLDTMQLSLLSLESQYPDNIKINVIKEE